jgi:hypothetical protein
MVHNHIIKSLRPQRSLSDQSPLSQDLFGSLIANKIANSAKHSARIYTPYPPAKFRSTENENNAVVRAGPMARASETVVCARPLVAPRLALLGADAVTKMNIAPMYKGKG